MKQKIEVPEDTDDPNYVPEHEPDVVFSAFGEFVFNKNGVCLNPYSVLMADDKNFKAILEYCQSERGWHYGYDYKYKGSGEGCGGGSGASSKNKYRREFKSKAEAIASGCDVLLKEFTKPHPMTKKSCKPVREAILAVKSAALSGLI